MNDQPLKVYIIAGEASGDFLGAHLMRALKQRVPDIRFLGIGGARMAEQGLSSLFPYHELSLMGFVEVLPYVFKIASRINYTVDDILSKRPDLVITIDSPGFCFRVVERLREERCPGKFVHYVAPTVWAYKPERAVRCARLFDHMLLLLPFEPPYFQKAGLSCTFIGHPIISETSPGDGDRFRKKYEIATGTKLFCLLPGSRKGEIKRHMPVFARSITLLAQHYRDLAIVVAVPKHVLPNIAPYFRNCPFRAVVTANEEDKRDALAASDIAIAKSGTITLEIAQAGTPMVISHRVHPISAWMLKRQATTPYVNLINILHQKEIIPELLQELCSPILLANAAFQLLESAHAQQTQKDYAQSALARLLPPGHSSSSELGANSILQLLNR